MIIPKDNARDLKEIPDDIKGGLDIKPVQWVDEVLRVALQELPKPLSDEEFQALEKQAQREAGADRINTH